MREVALIELETEDLTDDPDQTDGAYEAQLELAAAGEWEALGLDPPGAKDQPGFRPATIEDFLR